MPRFETHVLPNGTPGASRSVRDLADKYVQAEGGYSGDLEIEGSIDGTNWVAVASSVADSSITAVAHSLLLIRIDTTNVSAGTPLVTLAGYNTRET